MIALDTHAVVWWTQQPELLGNRAAEEIQRADGLEMHPDPADRFIVATAIHMGVPLLTKDNLLQSLSWLETVW